MFFKPGESRIKRLLTRFSYAARRGLTFTSQEQRDTVAVAPPPPPKEPALYGLIDNLRRGRMT